MEIEKYNKVWAYRQAMIDDIEFSVENDCIRCGTKGVAYQQIEGFTIQAHGGYSDFVDTAFDEEARVCSFCHDCSHKLMLFIGKRSPTWINSQGSTSHPRSYDKTDRSEYNKSWYHHGWDNRRIRGFISSAIYYFRLGGWRGTRYVIADLLEDRQNLINQELDWLNHLLEEIALDKNTKYTFKDIRKAELKVREAKQWKW